MTYRCSIFNMFDSCFLLSNSGYVVYAGPQHLALHYLAFVGFYKPAEENTADFLMDVIAGKSSQVLCCHTARYHQSASAEHSHSTVVMLQLDIQVNSCVLTTDQKPLMQVLFLALVTQTTSLLSLPHSGSAVETSGYNSSNSNNSSTQ